MVFRQNILAKTIMTKNGLKKFYQYLNKNINLENIMRAKIQLETYRIMGYLF